MLTSRDRWWRVVPAAQWTTLCRVEDPYNDPAYFFHQLQADLKADIANPAIVQVQIHESENGVNWAWNAYPPFQIVPGGEVTFSTYHVRRWVRVVVYSVRSGIVRGTKLPLEEQVLPGCILSPVTVESHSDPVVVQNGGLVPGYQGPCQFQYRFEASLDWEPVEWCWKSQGQALMVGGCWELYPDLDLYVRDMSVGEAGEAVYWNNPNGTNLLLNQDAYPWCWSFPAPPEIISGTFTEENSFYVWYNQCTDCSPVAEEVTKRITITNTGTCLVVVGDVTLNPGEVYALTDFSYAGYASGDMSAWLGGTPVPPVSS